MDLLRVTRGEAGREVEAELMSENAQSPGVRPVLLAFAVFEDVLEQLEVLNHLLGSTSQSMCALSRLTTERSPGWREYPARSIARRRR